MLRASTASSCTFVMDFDESGIQRRHRSRVRWALGRSAIIH